MVKRGKYVILEGGEGVGKTTQRDLLVEYLKTKNINAVSMYEPGSTPMGIEIRNLIKRTDLSRETMTNVLLFTAARAEMVKEIRKYLNDGVWVISDRSWLSTAAYQGYGERNVNLDDLDTIFKIALGDLVYPDVGLILSVPLNISDKRLEKRGEKLDYFELQNNEFMERVQGGYEALAKKLGWPIIDGDQSIEAVHQEIIKVIEPVIV